MSDIIKSNRNVPDTMQNLLNQPAIKTRFDEILGRRAPQFVSSIISIVNSNPDLSTVAKDNPMSVIQSALKAAIYNLPLGNELGLAYILPFKNYKTGKSEAQFVIGYKGQIQLALRTKRYKRLGVTDIRQGELKSYDYLYGDAEVDYVKDPIERAKLQVVGYLSGFKTIDGFEKQIFQTVEQIKEHEEKNRRGQYQSKTWRDNFDVMAKKTVLLMLLKTYAPRTQEEIIADQVDEWFGEPADENDNLPPDIDVIENVKPDTGEISQ